MYFVSSYVGDPSYPLSISSSPEGLRFKVMDTDSTCKESGKFFPSTVPVDIRLGINPFISWGFRTVSWDGFLSFPASRRCCKYGCD